MLTIDVPGFGEVQLKHLVCDFSGTLSVDGVLVDGVRERLEKLTDELEIHVLTADTHGTAKKALADVSCRLKILDPKYQEIQKEQYILSLGVQNVIGIGNGNNDQLMLKTARIGIAVCLAEGVSGKTIRTSDIITTSITDALDLLIYPKRLIATLRT
jgi:soluble P-type ATPase